jgi:hypothetical protein
MPPLEARGNKKLELDFEQQLNALILFHLDEHVSGSHLLQILEEDTLARQIVGTPAGIAKSTFFEAINTRGLSNFHTYLMNSTRAQQESCPRNMLISVSLSGSTAP